MPKPEDVLDAVLSGKLTRQQAAAEQPELGDQLSALSDLAEQLRDMPAERPDADFRNRARLRLLQHTQESDPGALPWWRRLTGTRLPGWAPGGAATILGAGLVCASVAYASGSALPGDKLYPIKRGVESVRVALSFTASSRVSAYLSMTDQRAGEIAAAAPDLDDSSVQALASDYASALQGLGASVQRLPHPSSAQLSVVEAHMASQATELEARALNSSSRPPLQQTLTHAEVVASQVSDQVELVAERYGQPSRRDVHLADNTSAASGAATTAHDGDIDQLWNEVSAAPFMGSAVRQTLEADLVAAKQDLHAAQTPGARAALTDFIAQLRDAVAASQATEYTASRLTASAQSLLAQLG